MKRVVVRAMSALLVMPVIAWADRRTDFPLWAESYSHGCCGCCAPIWHSDPTGQIVQALSAGLGDALDAAQDVRKREQIIDRWLNICEASKTDATKSRQESLQLQRENLLLREAVLDLRKQSWKLQKEIEQLQLEKLSLQVEIEKLQTENARLEKEDAAPRQER